MQDKLNFFNKTYNYFYNYGYSRSLTNTGDRLIRLCNDIIKEITELRRDIISSDRECAAFAVWCYMYHKQEITRYISNSELDKLVKIKNKILEQK